MKFMLRVEIADVSADWAVLGPPPGAGMVRPAGLADPWPHVGAGGYAYAVVGEDDHPGLERPWFEYLVPAAELESTLGEPPARRRLGSRSAPHRGVAAALGAETDDKTIPHELDLLRTAVHLNKGCYKGQETWRGSTTWAIRRAGWCSCSWTARSTPCPQSAATSVPVTARWAR